MEGAIQSKPAAEQGRGARSKRKRHPSRSSREEPRVRKALTSYLSPKTHRGYEIDYPDTAFENREDPGLHRYRTERPSFPRVVIYGARR